MAAAKFSGEEVALFEAVKTIGLEICPELGISIPVGKDSLSMQMQWEEKGEITQMVQRQFRRLFLLFLLLLIFEKQ